MNDDLRKLDSARLVLKTSLGLTAFLAGADKFAGVLADWPHYLSPAVRAILPVAPTTFMTVVGVIEMAVGIAILGRWTRAGSYLAMAWLLGIAGNFVVAGSFLDVAVRDVVLATAAFALARLTEALAAPRAVGAASRLSVAA